MKKRIIWAGVIILLILLGIRQFFNHKSGVVSERESYIAQLNFDFSGRIDSIQDGHHIIIHVTHGNLNRQKEKRLNDELKFNGRLDLFLYLPNDQMEMVIDNASKYQPGDSVYINSAKNSVAIYRHQQLLAHFVLARFLRGRPF